jgi:hypothetical protein
MTTRILGAAVAIAAVTGCGMRGGSGAATVMSGAAHAFAAGDTPANTGMEVRTFAGTTTPSSELWPNVIGMSARQIGDDREVAIGTGWQVGGTAGVGAFARLTANLIEWDRVAGTERLTAGGTTFEIGIAPSGAGLCASASATWDVRLEADDRAVVAGFLGFCWISR